MTPTPDPALAAAQADYEARIRTVPASAGPDQSGAERMNSFEDKADNAVHAAMDQLGLSVANNPDTADLLNDEITRLFANLASDDE